MCLANGGGTHENQHQAFKPRALHHPQRIHPTCAAAFAALIAQRFARGLTAGGVLLHLRFTVVLQPNPLRITP